MRPLRYSINVTLDGCCDHQAMIPDEELHRHAAESIVCYHGGVVDQEANSRLRRVAEALGGA